MATLQQIIDYSKANPTSDYAKTAQQHIQNGDFDEQAQKEGIDLSWAGRPTKTQTETTSSVSGSNAGPLGGVASFVGGKQLAQGVGQTIANAGGAQDATIKALNTSEDIQGNLIARIKADKAQGKDTTRLQSALDQLNQHIQGTSGQVEDLGTGGLSNKEVIGSTLQLGANAIPTEELGGLAGKPLSRVIGKVAPLAGKVIVGAGTGYAYDVANNLENNKSGASIATPGLGAAVGVTLPVLTQIGGYLTKKIAGFMSGTGDEAIQKALDNPTEVNSAINKYATTPEAKQQLVDTAKESISSFVKDKQAEYGKTLDSLTPAEGTVISKQPAISAFQEGLDKFGVEVDGKGKLDFSNSSLTKVDEGNVRNAWSKINGWTDETPQGLDKLRQTIGNFMKDFKVQGNPRANVILDGAQTALKNDLTKNLPGYGDMLTTYGEKSQLTNDVLKELQLGGTAKPSTQLKNILGLFKKDPALKAKVVSIMGEDGADKFMNDIAGAVMSSWLPQSGVWSSAGRVATEGAVAGSAALAGHAGLGGASIIPAIAASSPKIVGKGAVLAGKVAQTAIPDLTRKAITAGASKLRNQQNESK